MPETRHRLAYQMISLFWSLVCFQCMTSQDEPQHCRGLLASWLSFDTDFPFCTSIIIYCNDSNDNLLPHSHVWPRNPSQCRDRGLVTRAVWRRLLPGCFIIPLWEWQWKLQLSLPLEIKQQIPFIEHHRTHPVTLCMGPRSVRGRTPHTDILSLLISFPPIILPGNLY